ncbi:hypothetical protein CLU83_1914 [Flavobacterium sp. 1]|uniref:hypothetical protein n=1 Tax=Flavobacterium sp. 1 TaxID=2035200 RepID=UPI000C23312C|nr:hypothetical protein [Flavobacterium sp. 1]PJJ08628.1 hypothetical protein CLU83_1914 [Flavobacterium sp. 1]
MKKYKFYKKIEPVYFDSKEFICYLFFPIMLASCISYPILYLLDVKATIIFNVILALVANFFYNGLKNATPNGSNGNNGNNSLGVLSIFFEIIYYFSTFLTVFIVLFITDFGFYLLVVYQKTNQFNPLYFYLWLFTLFGLPVLYFAIKISNYYYIKWRQAVAYVTLILDVKHDLELICCVDNIQFVNTLNRKSSNFKINNYLDYYSPQTIEVMDKIYYTNKAVFRELVQIPFDTDMLLITWFSFVEDKCYSAEIPFPFKKLKIEQEKYPESKLRMLRGKETKPLLLHIYLNGGIKLFNKEGVLLIDSANNKEVPISKEDKEIKLLRFRHRLIFSGKTEDLPEIFNEIKTSGRIEARLSRTKQT